MLVMQFSAIQKSFGQSCAVLEHRFKDVALYSRLGCFVSRYALDNIALEEERCRGTLCMDKEICGCVQRTSYGLPCAYFIASKIREDKPILLDEIHHHLHKLSMGEESNEDGFLSRRSGMVFKNVSRKSLSNEARNERGFVVVGIS